MLEQATALVGDLQVWQFWCYAVGATVTGILTTAALWKLGRWLFEFLAWHWPWQ